MRSIVRCALAPLVGLRGEFAQSSYYVLTACTISDAGKASGFVSTCILSLRWILSMIDFCQASDGSRGFRSTGTQSEEHLMTTRTVSPLWFPLGGR